MRDPETLYERFLNHRESCVDCTPVMECPDGHRLLMAWGREEDREIGIQSDREKLGASSSPHTRTPE